MTNKKVIAEAIESIQELKAIENDLIMESNDYMSPAEVLTLLKEVRENIESLENNISEAIDMDLTTEGVEFLQEVNIRRLDPKTQRHIRKIFISIQLAKQAKDPLYDKYKRGVDLRKRFKAAILNKYGNKALQIAMQEQNSKK